MGNLGGGLAVAPSPEAIIPPAEHLQQLKFYKDQIMELISNKKWDQPRPPSSTKQRRRAFFSVCDSGAEARREKASRNPTPDDFVQSDLKNLSSWSSALAFNVDKCRFEVLFACAKYAYVSPHSPVNSFCLCRVDRVFPPRSKKKKFDLNATAITTPTHNVLCLEGKSLA